MRTDSHASRLARAVTAMAVGTATCVLVAGPVDAAPAKPKVQKLQYYAMVVAASVTDNEGKRVTDPKEAGEVGNRFQTVASYFKGDHRKFAKKPSGLHQVDCTIKSETTAVCDIVVRLKRGKIFAENQEQAIGKQAGASKVKITGGSGKYKKARGSMTSKTVDARGNSDITIKLKKR